MVRTGKYQYLATTRLTYTGRTQHLTHTPKDSPISRTRLSTPKMISTLPRPSCWPSLMNSLISRLATCAGAKTLTYVSKCAYFPQTYSRSCRTFLSWKRTSRRCRATSICWGGKARQSYARVAAWSRMLEVTRYKHADIASISSSNNVREREVRMNSGIEDGQTDLEKHTTNLKNRSGTRYAVHTRPSSAVAIKHDRLLLF